jgi:hypothetical protein
MVRVRTLTYSRALMVGLAVAGCGGGNSAGGPGSDASTGPDATSGHDAASSPEVSVGGDASDASVASDASEGSAPSDASGPGDAEAGPAKDAGTFTLSLSDASVVSTYAQRAALGFRFGYVDGVLGAVNRGDAGYAFFVSGHTVADAGACPGTPDTQGSYHIGVAPDVITQNFGCKALIADSENVVPDGGLTGPFDRDYVGGGPVLVLTHAGSRALALFYHAEWHWGPTCNGAPCFYGTLGLAFSTDDGQSFTKYGEIVQPAVSRPDWVSGHASTSLSIGAGPYLLGDANGGPVDPTGADPATSYVYVFFDDYDTTNAAPCANSQCLGVARASMQDLVSAAFGLAGAKSATALFSKYHTSDPGGPFTQPAASGSTDDTTAGGHYTAILSNTFEASTLYDRTAGAFFLAYRQGGAIQLTTSTNVTSWPGGPVASVTIDDDAGVRYPSLMGEQPNAEVGATQPYIFYTNGTGTWPTSTFMSRRITVTPGP